MEPTTYQLTFTQSHQAQTQKDEDNISLEILPCIFQKSLESTNKDIYFDSLVRDADKKFTPNLANTTSNNSDSNQSSTSSAYKQVSLQGRRMIGKDHKLPQGYQGVVYGRKITDSYFAENEMKQNVVLEQIGHFNQITEWQKDIWSDEHGYPKALIDYIEAQQIIHGTD